MQSKAVSVLTTAWIVALAPVAGAQIVYSSTDNSIVIPRPTSH